jgi:hypothetical protein
MTHHKRKRNKIYAKIKAQKKQQAKTNVRIKAQKTKK